MDSWDLALTAENKSPTTIASYLRRARLYVEWCEGNGHPVEITRAQVQTYREGIDTSNAWGRMVGESASTIAAALKVSRVTI